MTRTYDVTVKETQGLRGTVTLTITVDHAAKEAKKIARKNSHYNSPKVIIAKRVVTKRDGTLSYKRD
jgi:hypothetical protein